MEKWVTFTFVLFLTLVLGVTAQRAPDIRIPPTIQKPTVADSWYYRQGENVTLHCEATGRPKPFYIWLWNDIEITADDSRFTVNGQTGNLTINALTVKTEGFFKCKAQVTFSSGSPAVAVSPEVEVRVGRIEDWNRIDDDTPVKGNEGEYAILKCDSNLPVTYSVTTFVWHEIEGKRQQELRMDERMFIDSKGSLHFTYLREKDNFGVDGYYACGLNNQVARNSKVGGKRKLEVTKVDNIPRLQPQIRYWTGSDPDDAKDLTFKVGQKARLECVFSGYITGRGDHLPEIEWFEGQRKIVSGQGRYSIENRGRVLTIDRVDEADEKAYVCRAKENEVQAVMNLNVTAPPIFVEPYMKHQIVTEGKNAVFHCVARSAAGEFPLEEPVWYQNGRRMVNFDRNKFKFEDGKTKLTVISLNKESDISCFQCVVSNSVSSRTQEAYLNVILPIQILKKPGKVQTIKAGSIVDLTVQATSDPLFNLTYTWEFRGKTYGAGSAPPYVIYNIGTKVAYINTTGLTNQQLGNISGTYSRIIYHSEETVNISTEVRYKEKIAAVKAEPGFPYWIIAVIIFGLFLLVCSVIVVHVICRRKRQEGAYPLVKKEIAAGLNPEKDLKDSEFQDLS